MAKTMSIFHPLIISIFLSFPNPIFGESDSAVVVGSSDDEWVYYGFAPGINYTPPAIITREMVINNATWLTIVGYNDSTHVAVYDIAGGRNTVLGSFEVHRMKAHTVPLPIEGCFSIETFFKVVSDKPIAVLMSGGLGEWSGANVFYPSTDGGYSGKEFIIVCARGGYWEGGQDFDHAAFAIEDSTVEIRDNSDKVIRTLNIAANSSKRLGLVWKGIYRITSTGRILVSSWAGSTFIACPSHMGGYVGRVFFSQSGQDVRSGSTVLLILSQEGPAQVKVYDTSTGSLIVEKSLPPREMWFINRDVADLGGARLKVQSNEEVTVYAGGTVVEEGALDTPALMDQGIVFSTVSADKPTTIFTPTQAYVFSPNSHAEINIDGSKMTVQRGSRRNIPSGKITVMSNATVIIEAISMQPSISRFATYLLPASRLEVTYPPPKPSEAVDRMAMTPYYIAAAIATAAIVGIIVLRKHIFKAASFG